jgi:hypothetical protein
VPDDTLDQFPVWPEFIPNLFRQSNNDGPVPVFVRFDRAGNSPPLLGVAAVWCPLHEAMPVRAGFCRHPEIRQPDGSACVAFQTGRFNAIPIAEFLIRSVPCPMNQQQAPNSQQ